MSTEPWPYRDRCAIAGIGATRFTKQSESSVLGLAVEAANAALADAGLDPRAVDGIVHCDHDTVRHNDLAHALGIPALTYWGSTGTAGGAPCGMVGQAVAAVLSGLATTVIVFRALKGRSGRRYGQGGASGSRPVGGNNTYDEFFAPSGLTVPAHAFALMARRHMQEFGTTRDHLAAIALECRARANTNPAAQMFDRPLSAEQYLDAPVISSPLHRYDCCLETDGACAVIVTSAERARDLARRPAMIRAVAQSTVPGGQGGTLFPALMREDVTTWPSAAAGDVLYRRAGLRPGDVDVAQLYDCFTITVLVQLEDYGFCKKGQGGPFAASGALALDGRLPINTAGGNLSEGYIHGLNHVVEGVRQIRGESTAQAPRAEVCLVTSGVPVATSALLLTRA